MTSSTAAAANSATKLCQVRHSATDATPAVHPPASSPDPHPPCCVALEISRTPVAPPADPPWPDAVAPAENARPPGSDPVSRPAETQQAPPRTACGPYKSHPNPCTQCAYRRVLVWPSSGHPMLSPVHSSLARHRPGKPLLARFQD